MPTFSPPLREGISTSQDYWKIPQTYLILGAVFFDGERGLCSYLGDLYKSATWKLPEKAFTVTFPETLEENLVQNAVDSIEGRKQEDEGNVSFEGEVRVTLTAFDGEAVIEVLDNGKGLPPEARDRLTEPYVTTRAKGTGLGLAIVKTILEDHGADLKLEDRREGGARVEIRIPMLDREASTPVSDVGAV